MDCWNHFRSWCENVEIQLFLRAVHVIFTAPSWIRPECVKAEEQDGFLIWLMEMHIRNVCYSNKSASYLDCIRI